MFPPRLAVFSSVHFLSCYFFVHFFLALGSFYTIRGRCCLSIFMIKEEAEGYRKLQWVSIAVGKV